jgi:hypothetical protein
MIKRLASTFLWMVTAIILTIGSAPSSAIAKEKTAAPQEPVYCIEIYAPVCGEIKGVKKTYSNSCFARAAGAKIVGQGPCAASK